MAIEVENGSEMEDEDESDDECDDSTTPMERARSGIARQMVFSGQTCPQSGFGVVLRPPGPQAIEVENGSEMEDEHESDDECDDSTTPMERARSGIARQMVFSGQTCPQSGFGVVLRPPGPQHVHCKSDTEHQAAAQQNRHL
eukprot:TRINITY_DN1059_c0_g1_i10.p3 TRINITY_DN1059_c0_g1~~TRINITY_DN1059_c0_g1_i10.p3  ORF type:complete len:142 (+),score=8.59 TRINITY_DN1059_c0_g1_i10:212-637(+)